MPPRKLPAYSRHCGYTNAAAMIDWLTTAFSFLVHARAKVAGADIVQQLTDRDYGSREFICRDPEGNVWSVGTYWPKAGEPAA